MANADIRQLEMDGSVFYPQTDINGLVNNGEFAIVDFPEKDSNNLVSSKGVFNSIGAFDISELNATENPHTLATYADLPSALNALPSEYRKGGMSVKFV